MDYPQTLSAQTASTYPTTPAASQEKESSYKNEQTDSNFSVGDAAWVVMRTLSTAAECLNFVCRKVVVLSSVCVGGFTGLLQYAHENLGDRTVQKVPAEDNNRTDHQPISWPVDKEPGDKAQQTAYRQNPPVEEYVRQGANKWKHFVESSTTPGSEYSWVHLAGMVMSITLSVYVLGIVGTIILHTPHWLLKAEPYINLNKPTPPQSAATPPSSHQDQQTPALDPIANSRPLDNPASQPPPPPVEPTAVTSTGEPGLKTLSFQSAPAAEASSNNQGSQQSPLPTNQYRTASTHESLIASAQTTQQPATGPACFAKAHQHASVQPSVQNSVQKRLHSSTTTSTGDHIPTSVPVHQF